MNGYGHFVPALFWSITYWLAITALAGRHLHRFRPPRRGGFALRARARLALQRAPRLDPRSLCCSAVIAAGAAAGTYYNAHVLNEYLDSKARRDIQADYERKFKKYENLLQPKVTAVDATINIYPERRSFDGTVRMTLQNKTAQPIPRSTSPT
jgi:ABC-2 type transport system permease protein